MNSSKKSKLHLLIGTILFLAFFGGIAFLFIQQTNRDDIRRLKYHAEIITDDVWALNESSTQTYLQLAATTDHYRSLRVVLDNHEIFFNLNLPPQRGVEELLFSCGLITTRKVATPLVYANRTIGILEGEKYVRVIFPLLNLLIVLLLLLLTALFIWHLAANRRYLEIQVAERTSNLRESERRFHDLVNLLPEMVWETDTEGQVIYANQLALPLLPIGPTDQPQPAWFMAIVPEQRESARQYFLKIINGEPQNLQEFKAIGEDAKSLPLLIRSSPIRRHGKVVGTRSVAIDITERYAFDEQLRRAQRMEAIGLMAGGVAHDLNNILSGIVTYPQLLLLDLPLDSPLRHPIEAIQRSGIAAADVVADLLTVARGVAANKEIGNLNTIIENYLTSPDFAHLASRYPRIHFVPSLATDLLNISCSLIHIRKCLMNLITNAAEAISTAGTVWISTENRTLHPAQANTANLPPGTYAVLTLKDDGPGIPAQSISHIFEPFYSKKELGRSGTGLGLTIVWNTVREHDGAITVESSTSGTLFSLYFPSVTTTIIKKNTDSDWLKYLGQGEKILVIDDDPLQREIATQILDTLHYSSSAVASGEEALAYLHDHPVDLLIIDMLMGAGMNGRQTYQQVLRINPEQKGIVATGYSESDDVQATLNLGAGCYIAKPYTIKKLSQAVHGELHRLSKKSTAIHP